MIGICAVGGARKTDFDNGVRAGCKGGIIEVEIVKVISAVIRYGGESFTVMGGLAADFESGGTDSDTVSGSRATDIRKGRAAIRAVINLYGCVSSGAFEREAQAKARVPGSVRAKLKTVLGENLSTVIHANQGLAARVECLRYRSVTRSGECINISAEVAVYCHEMCR
jgi:hypothetical protein